MTALGWLFDRLAVVVSAAVVAVGVTAFVAVSAPVARPAQFSMAFLTGAPLTVASAGIIPGKPGASHWLTRIGRRTDIPVIKRAS